MNKNTQIAARVNEAEREALKSIAEALDIPEAQIIREAVREKVQKLRKQRAKKLAVETA